MRIITVIIIALMACGEAMASPRAPDGEQVRRVAMDLGVGRYVAVTFSSGETLRGYIKAIADDHFALLVDGWPAAGDIPYRDVQWIGPVPQLVPTVSRVPSARKTLVTVGLAAYFVFMAVCGQPGRC